MMPKTISYSSTLSKAYTLLKAWLIALLIIASSCSSELPELATDEEILGYLRDNTHSLTLNNTTNYSEFEPIADHFSGKRMILLGENHGSQFNDLLDTKMMIYLHQNHEVRYYLGETGYGLGIFINQYINTGEESLLSSIMNSWRGTFSYTQENKARLQRLKDYNLSLPEEERITYVGIDIENQVSWAIRAVDKIVRFRGPMPSQIVVNLSRVFAGSSRTYLGAVELAKDLLADFENEDVELEYATFLGNDFEEVKFILENLLVKAETDLNPSEFNAIREPKIAANFKYISQRYPNGKFYGKWGQSHIWKVPVERNYTTFVERLIFDGDLSRDEVESLPIFYEEGFFASPTYNYEARPITFSEAPDLLATPGSQALTFFDLNEPSSPFSRTNKLVTGRNDFTSTIVATVIKLKYSPASNKAFD